MKRKPTHKVRASGLAQSRSGPEYLSLENPGASNEQQAAIRKSTARQIKQVRQSGYTERLHKDIEITYDKGFLKMRQDIRAKMPKLRPAEKVRAEKAIQNIRADERLLARKLGVNTVDRMMTAKQLGRQMADKLAGKNNLLGRIKIAGMKALAPASVVGTAMDWKDFQKGVDQGRTMREKAAPTGATFAGKPYKPRKKVKTRDPGGFKQ